MSDAVPVPVVRTKAGNKSPYSVFGKTYSVFPSSDGYEERGVASWYGRKFHGRLTSNGEVFDMYGMTAAHKHLPIPTYVKVTSLANNKSVLLRVNDRGPFHGDRVIDLSWAAAAKLGFADAGTAEVLIQALDAENPDGSLVVAMESEGKMVNLSDSAVGALDQITSLKELYFQVASLSDETSAQALKLELANYTKYPVRIAQVHRNDEKNYKVMLGPLSSRAEAQELSVILDFVGLKSGFIVQL